MTATLPAEAPAAPGWPQRLGLPDTTGQRTFLVAMLVDTLGSGAFVPFTLLYFRITTDLSLTAIGLGLTIATLAALPTGPWFGALTDRCGPRPVSVLSNVLRAAGTAAYLVVPSLPLLIAASLLVTVGDRAFWASYGALVGEVAAPGERQRWFALLTSARSLGLGLGALVGGLVLERGGTTGARGLALLDAVSFAVAAVLLARVRTRRPAGPREVAAGAWSTVLRDRGYLLLTVANALLTFAFLVVGFLPVYLVETLRLPGWVAGAVFGVNATVIVTLQTTTTRFTEDRRRTRVLAAAGVAIATAFAGYLGAEAVPHPVVIATVLAACVLFTLGEMLYAPTSDALAAEAAPEHLRGRYVSVYQLSWSVSGTVGPVLVGALLDTGPVQLWSSLAALVLLGAAVVLLAERRLPAGALLPAGRRP